MGLLIVNRAFAFKQLLTIVFMLSVMACAEGGTGDRGNRLDGGSDSQISDTSVTDSRGGDGATLDTMLSDGGPFDNQGVGWANVGSTLPNLIEPKMTIAADGRVFVVGYVPSGGSVANTVIRVYEYSAGDWVQRGAELAANGQGCCPSITSSGSEVFVSHWSNSQGYIYRWNGTAWTLVTTGGVGTGTSFLPQTEIASGLAAPSSSPVHAMWLALNANNGDLNDPMRIKVYRSEGSNLSSMALFAELDGVPNQPAALAPKLALNADKVALAWSENGVRCYQRTNGAFAPLGTQPLDPGGGIAPSQAHSPALQINPAGNAVVLFSAAGTGNSGQKLFVQAFNGSAWQSWASSMDANTRDTTHVQSPDIESYADGVAVAWSEESGAGSETMIYLRRCTATGGCVALGAGMLDRVSGQSASSPSLALHPSGWLFVAWSEGMALSIARFNPGS